jgi:hypothetical protein
MRFTNTSIFEDPTNITESPIATISLVDILIRVSKEAASWLLNPSAVQCIHGTLMILTVVNQS